MKKKKNYKKPTLNIHSFNFIVRLNFLTLHQYLDKSKNYNQKLLHSEKL